MISFISLNIDTTEFISVVLLYTLDPKQMFIQGFPKLLVNDKMIRFSASMKYSGYLLVKRKKNKTARGNLPVTTVFLFPILNFWHFYSQ